MREPVIVSYNFKASVEQIWNAITIPAEMKKWYFSVQDFQLKPGNIFTFYETESGGTFLHRCEILTIVPHELMVHTWEHPSHSAGKSQISWALSPNGSNSTTLTLTHEGVENFADAGPEFKRENYELGWHTIIKTSLRNYLYGIEKLVVEININAPVEKVWKLMWEKDSYKQWTKAFMDGSYYTGDLEEGNRIHFLSPSGAGMYSDLIQLKLHSYIVFSHIGYLKEKQEMDVDDETLQWTGSLEGYYFSQTPTGTHIRAELDNQKAFHDSMQQTFRAALVELKRMAEAN